MCWFCVASDTSSSHEGATKRVYKPVPAARQAGWLGEDRYAAWPARSPRAGDGGGASNPLGSEATRPLGPVSPYLEN